MLFKHFKPAHAAVPGGAGSTFAYEVRGMLFKRFPFFHSFRFFDVRDAAAPSRFATMANTIAR